MFPFTCDHLHSITYRTLMCFSWGRYFLPLIICLKNMVLISSKSLKSYYKDLRSPLIFIEPKFSKIFIKILKRFLKVFGLFISVKKYLTKIFKKIFYFWRPFKISEDLWTSSKYFQPWENEKNMLKYTKMLLHCMFHLYFSGW